MNARRWEINVPSDATMFLDHSVVYVHMAMHWHQMGDTAKVNLRQNFDYRFSDPKCIKFLQQY